MVMSAIAESDTLSSDNAIGSLDMTLFGVSSSLSSSSVISIIGIYGSAISSSLSSSNIVVTLTQVLSLVYSGDIAVGDTVCIDSVYFSVKHNGVNAISKYDGEFMEIVPNLFEFVYTDLEENRSAKITVSWRDRIV